MKAVDEASANHFAGTELLEEFGKEPRYVEKSADNHFMYYSGMSFKYVTEYVSPLDIVQEHDRLRVVSLCHTCT